MNQPGRRQQRRAHLDAATVPVERALLARAEMLEQQSRDVLDAPDAGPGLLSGTVLAGIAQEFRKLAEELHWVA